MHSRAIRHILSDHKKWIEGQKNGKRADFYYANLSGLNLANTNLQQAYFRGAILEGTNFRGANLRGANFIGANLQTANFRDADLEGAFFQGAYFYGSSFQRSILRGCDFQEAQFVKVNISDADITDASFAFLTIDTDMMGKLPLAVRDKFGETWYPYHGATGSWTRELIIYPSDNDTDNTIVRSIEFPPEYHQAGISILNYFSTVLHQKYPDKECRVTIEQDGLIVTMIIVTADGDREIIERTLEDYGLVVNGLKTANELLADPFHVMALQQKLEIANLEIRQITYLLSITSKQYDNKIDLLEKEIIWMRNHVGNILAYSEKQNTAMQHLAKETIVSINMSFTQLASRFNDIANNHTDITAEIMAMQNILAKLNPDKVDINAFEKNIEIVKEKEPSIFNSIVEVLEQFSIGVAGSIWATVITDTIKRL